MSPKSRGALACAAIDHPCVLSSFENWKQPPQKIYPLPIENFRYSWMPFGGPEDKQQAILFCLQAANNESGLVNELSELIEQIRCEYPRAQILVDACQALGKMPFTYFHKFIQQVDYLAMSAHKIGALAGTGALLSCCRQQLLPLIYGGHQEQGLRAGTHNIHGVVTFVEAMRLWAENGEQYRAIMQRLRQDLVAALAELPQGQVLFEELELEKLPNTVLLQVGAWVDELFAVLDLAGIAVSRGSACSSESCAPSRVMQAYGFDDRESRQCLRISLHHRNTVEDVDFLVKTLGDFFRVNS